MDAENALTVKYYWPGTAIRIIFPAEVTPDIRHANERGKIFSCSNMDELMVHIEWIKQRKQIRADETRWDQIIVLGKLADQLRETDLYESQDHHELCD